MCIRDRSRTATLRRLLGEVNDVVVVFLNFIISNFAPFAVVVLLTRTFAIYGIDYLKPALVYVVVTVVLLLAFLIIAYPLVIALGAKPVSYTHLDVYKRQIKCSVILQMESQMCFPI